MGSPKLSDAGQDAFELPENQHRAQDAFRLPASGRFESRQHVIEPLTQVIEHVIAIQTHTVHCVHGGGTPSHENSARHKVLKVPFGRKQLFPLWKRIHK